MFLPHLTQSWFLKPVLPSSSARYQHYPQLCTPSRLPAYSSLLNRSCHTKPTALRLGHPGPSIPFQSHPNLFSVFCQSSADINQALCYLMFNSTVMGLDSVIYLAVNGTVTSLPVFIQNTLNCVPKTNKAFTGLERHGGKWLMTKFSFWGGVTL